METEDPRVHRTRKLLWDSLLELLGIRGFSRISVSEIAGGAGVNRATFYRHFESKEDLFRQGCREMLLPLAREMSTRTSHFDDREAIASNIGHLFKLVGERRALFLTLLRSEGNAEAFAIAEDLIFDVLFKERLLGLPADPGPGKLRAEPALLAHTMTAMMTGLLRWWIVSEAPYSPEEIAAVYAAILYGGSSSFF